ncbi:MAG: DUF2058 family protein [Planctomycetes bacterium]|nr:DUF2058 family protein [Planctomycetota bacterium]
MSLRDQFKKAKILSDKDSKRLAHEARVERSEKGREQIEREQQARQQEIEQLRQSDREQSRREQEKRERDRKEHEELAAVRTMIADARKPGPGAVKFYFATADGNLPWLELSPREAQEVRAGALCVVRKGPAGTHTYGLLDLESCKRVARTLPDAVVHAPRGVAS